MAPLCKGGWIFLCICREKDWGIDNPSVSPSGCHLPLHKGGFGAFRK